MTRTLIVKEKLNSLADSPVFAEQPSTHYILVFFSTIRKHFLTQGFIERHMLTVHLFTHSMEINGL